MPFLVVIALLIGAIVFHASAGNTGMMLFGIVLAAAWLWHFRGTRAGVLGPPMLADPVLNVGTLVILLVSSAVVVVAAFLNFSNKVVLSDGRLHLTYDCDRFRPQAATGADIGIVIKEFGNLVQDASQAHDVVTLSSLPALAEAHDIRGMERTIVEYRCGHR